MIRVLVVVEQKDATARSQLNGGNVESGEKVLKCRCGELMMRQVLVEIVENHERWVLVPSNGDIKYKPRAQQRTPTHEQRFPSHRIPKPTFEPTYTFATLTGRRCFSRTCFASVYLATRNDSVGPSGMQAIRSVVLKFADCDMNMQWLTPSGPAIAVKSFQSHAHSPQNNSNSTRTHNNARRGAPQLGVRFRKRQETRLFRNSKLSPAHVFGHRG